MRGVERTVFGDLGERLVLRQASLTLDARAPVEVALEVSLFHGAFYAIRLRLAIGAARGEVDARILPITPLE